MRKKMTVSAGENDPRPPINRILHEACRRRAPAQQGQEHDHVERYDADRRLRRAHRDGRGAARRGDRAQARPRLARRGRRGGAAPAGHRLHAPRHLHGREVPPLRRVDERPHPGGRRRPDEGGVEVRPRPRRALLHLRGLVDQGVDPGLCDAELVAGPDRLHLQPEGAVLQHASGPRQARARARRRVRGDERRHPRRHRPRARLPDPRRGDDGGPPRRLRLLAERAAGRRRRARVDGDAGG